MTNRDYPGTTYYTIRNVSLYECLGWCRDEVDCTSAAFSFVVNPLAPIQETTCMLQNSTQARINGPGSGPTAVAPTVSGPPQLNPPAGLMPQKAVNLYFFNKVQIRSGKIFAYFSTCLGFNGKSAPFPSSLYHFLSAWDSC